MMLFLSPFKLLEPLAKAKGKMSSLGVHQSTRVLTNFDASSKLPAAFIVDEQLVIHMKTAFALRER